VHELRRVFRQGPRVSCNRLRLNPFLLVFSLYDSILMNLPSTSAPDSPMLRNKIKLWCLHITNVIKDHIMSQCSMIYMVLRIG